MAIRNSRVHVAIKVRYLHLGSVINIRVYFTEESEEIMFCVSQ